MSDRLRHIKYDTESLKNFQNSFYFHFLFLKVDKILKT